MLDKLSKLFQAMKSRPTQYTPTRLPDNLLKLGYTTQVETFIRSDELRKLCTHSQCRTEH